MHDDIIMSDKLITLSRDFVDDVMGDKRIIIRKEHYYLFAISNFIATKEYFLKKISEKGRSKVIFDYDKNNDILPMIIEFYNSIKINNQHFTEPSITFVKNKINIIPNGIYSDDEYMALYFFHEIRNSLSHAGNYVIKRENNKTVVCINNLINIPLELFDFIAFYINSYIDGVDVNEIFQNYLIYKRSKDNKKYYSFESDDAINKISSLLAKTKIRIKQLDNYLTKNRSGNISNNYIKNIIDELRYDYGNELNDIIDKILNANVSDEKKDELIVQLDIIYRANKRLANIKIDKCIENIESLLKLDKKSSCLYAHSIILFTNQNEPTNTNEQYIKSNIEKIIKQALSIKVNSDLDNQEKIIVLLRYQEIIEKLLDELPNLIRINEHEYRNSIFHNNIEFKNEILHFWNQKDNSNPTDIHTFDKYITPEAYNIELKTIEGNTFDVGEMTIENLLYILCQYFDTNIIYEMFGKLWNINQVDSDLLRSDMSIDNLHNNIRKIMKYLSKKM